MEVLETNEDEQEQYQELDNSGIQSTVNAPATPKTPKKSRGKKSRESKKKKATTPKGGPLQGGAFIRHIIKKGGKNAGPLSFEDLDEEILKQRLELLEKELFEYKDRCARYKKDNSWYRDEIEASQKDTANYIKYLESKKDEKLDIINHLTESNKKDLETFIARKKEIEEQNNKKLDELRQTIAQLEDKLNNKEEDFFGLSDTMARRAKHEAELSKIKKEIRDAESNHQEQILEMEKSLLDTRIRLQKESDEKIRIMEAAAEEKAAKYLADHSSTLEKENRLLEIELEKMSIKVKRLLERKDQLTNENSELEREQRLKQDLVTIRLKNISNAEEKERRERYKRSCRIAEERQRKMSDLIERKGLGLATKSKMNHVDFKTADAHGWIDLESEDDD